MVTIKDIARRLEVSASTVGRALSDDPRISAAMKKKVAEVANELGYVANRAARMMRGASSNLVGLVVPDIRNSFYSTISASSPASTSPASSSCRPLGRIRRRCACSR
jgi:LacI family transcriptional regulator